MRPDAEVRDVNQSPCAKRLTVGTKYVSKSVVECCGARVRSDSTALSRTIVSST